METATDFIFLGSKITAHSDCSHEIKICFLLGRKAMTNLESILKRTDITLPMKFCLVKAMVYPVVMYGCESWTIKNWCQRIYAFELWCWWRLLRIPWTARRSNQSILKEISPEYSLEGLMMKLKLQSWNFSHLMWRTDSLEKTLMLGKTEGMRRRGRQRMRWLDGITDLMDMSLSKLMRVGDGQGSLASCSPWGGKESDMTERLTDDFPDGPVVKSLPMQGVRALTGEPRSHMPQGQKTKTENRNNIVTNSIKTLKMVHIKNFF